MTVPHQILRSWRKQQNTTTKGNQNQRQITTKVLKGKGRGLQGPKNKKDTAKKERKTTTTLGSTETRQ